MTTPIDPRAEPPEQPKTAQIPAADKNAILLAELKQLMVAGQAALVAGQTALEERVDNGFRATKADMDLLAGHVEVLERDVRGMQSWRVRVEDRLQSNSMRAQATSTIDSEQDAKLSNALVALAEEKERREQLERNSATKADLAAITESQTAAILAGFESFKKSPLVKMAIAAVLAAATTWLATKGVHLP